MLGRTSLLAIVPLLLGAAEGVACAPPADEDPPDEPPGSEGSPETDVDQEVTSPLLEAPLELGTPVGLESAIASRWNNSRRMMSTDDGRRVFTGRFTAGKFSTGDGHVVRLKIAPGSEYLLEYRVRFDPGFDFSRGGKLPGLAGGNAPSGCKRSTDVGFTARQMWRQQGRLIGYVYDMDQRTACGNAIEAGFNFSVGRWYRIRQRIKLNSGSSRNGLLQLFLDDRLVVSRSNVGWMIEGANRRIDRVMLDFFFGGSTADWSPRRNCSISFGDVFVTRLAN